VVQFFNIGSSLKGNFARFLSKKKSAKFLGRRDKTEASWTLWQVSCALNIHPSSEITRDIPQMISVALIRIAAMIRNAISMQYHASVVLMMMMMIFLKKLGFFFFFFNIINYY
jgi:hypothetical protein